MVDDPIELADHSTKLYNVREFISQHHPFLLFVSFLWYEVFSNATQQLSQSPLPVR